MKNEISKIEKEIMLLKPKEKMAEKLKSEKKIESKDVEKVSSDNDSKQDDWRSSCNSLVQQWGEARKRNLHTDIEFLVGTAGSAVSFSAHKIILTFCSPVFEAMFYGQLAETSPISIVDIGAETFEIILRYAYGEEVTFASAVSAAETYIAADKYLIHRLKTTAENYITESTMNETEFWEIILQDKYFCCPTMKSKYLDYLAQHANTLLQNDMLLSVSLDIMKAILQLDSLNASEYDILLATARWGHANFASHKNNETESMWKSLLPYIRFSNLSTSEFSNFDEAHRGMIASDDSLDILKYLCNPSMFALPQWCSASTQKRKAVHKYNNTYRYEPYSRSWY